MPIYTKITKFDLSEFAYRLFHEHFSSIVTAKRYRHETACEQINADKLTSVIFVHRALYLALYHL